MHQETEKETQEREEGDWTGDEGTKEEFEERSEVKETGKPVRQTETVVFIPSTPGSKLKNLLQSQDNLITSSMNTPQVRFVERSGTTVMEDLGRTNPWAAEWFCPRKDCVPCQGRSFGPGNRGRSNENGG